MRTREEQIKPWGYISPFATETLRDRAKCDLTITKKATHNITMPLYTAEHILEAERRAEQRVRAEIALDSERLDWLSEAAKRGMRLIASEEDGGGIILDDDCLGDVTAPTLRDAIDAAREVGDVHTGSIRL